MTDRPPRPDGGWQAVLEQSCVSVRASIVKHNRKIDATIPGRPAPPHPPCQGCWVEESKLPPAFRLPLPRTLLWRHCALTHSVFKRKGSPGQINSHCLVPPKMMTWPWALYPHWSQGPAAGRASVRQLSTVCQLPMWSAGAVLPGSPGQQRALASLVFPSFWCPPRTWSQYALYTGLLGFYKTLFLCLHSELKCLEEVFFNVTSGRTISCTNTIKQSHFFFQK